MSRLHKPKAGAWIRFVVMVLYPLDGLLYKIRYRNLDRVTPPSEGGVIIALNHISHIDTVLMARAVWQSGRVPRFMVKSGVFAKPILGQIMRGSKQIPVYRGTTDASNSLRDAVTALAAGEAIVIYPEGTISKDPAQWPMQAKTGIARLVLLSPDTPVIPMGQWGAQKRKFTISRLVKRPVCEVAVGKPVDLSRFRGAEPTSAVLREITDTIMAAVRDEVAVLRGETAPTTFFKLPSAKDTAAITSAE
jgi:1-acyl-sn-glycerol-3-phosphate acyltransferase